jgi:hypothetical protein
VWGLLIRVGFSLCPPVSSEDKEKGSLPQLALRRTPSIAAPRTALSAPDAPKVMKKS